MFCRAMQQALSVQGMDGAAAVFKKAVGLTCQLQQVRKEGRKGGKCPLSSAVLHVQQTVLAVVAGL